MDPFDVYGDFLPRVWFWISNFHSDRGPYWGPDWGPDWVTWRTDIVHAVLDLEAHCAWMELPRLFPTPETMPVALRDIVGKPEVRARMRREALAGLLGACEETDEQRKRRGPEL